MVCLLAGCASANRDHWDGPRIFSIGRQATLSFDRNTPLLIPVEGLALASGFRYRVDVTLSGTYPIAPGHFQFDDSPFRTNANVLSIMLDTNYLANVHTGDILDVAVHVHELAPVDALMSAIAEAATSNLQDADPALRFAKVRTAGDYFLKILDSTTSRVDQDRREQIQYFSEDLHTLLNELNQGYDTWATRSRLSPSNVSTIYQGLKQTEKEQRQAWNQLVDADYALYRSTRSPRSAAVAELLGREWTLDAERADDLVRQLEDYGKELDTLASTLFPDAEKSAKILEPLRENVRTMAGQVGELSDKKKRQTVLDAGADQRTIERRSREVMARIQSSVVLVGDLLPDLLRGSTRSVSTASRTFTFYEFEDFRQDYHGKRVLPADIMAFPEPEEGVEKLFGKSISRRYFVVRLSVRNTEDEDRLIATGMIRARGRAMVESMAGRKRNSPSPRGDAERFTVPVEVAPHSVQQVYAALTDKSAWSTRAVVFRSLELAGTVASAYALTFGSSETVKDAIQLATGVGIPAFSKFWTDQLPGYQRNIVNFGMPELVKVPRGGVSSHKFLFFPKEAIEGMIIDHNSYGSLEGPWKPEAFRQPFTAVAYLTFDNLEIPFENVFEAGSDTERQALLALRADLTGEVSARTQIRENWVAGRPGSRFEITPLTIERIQGAGANDPGTVVKASLARWTAFDPHGDAQRSTLRTTLTNALATVEAIRLALTPANVRADGPLLGGLPALELARGDLEDMSSAMMAGKPLGPYRPRFEEIEGQTRTAEQVLAFYRKAAALLADGDLLARIPAATPAAGGSLDVNKADSLAEDLRARLAELAGLRNAALREARIVESLQAFAPAK
ncbi:MAG: hypothetical protein H7A45_17080 [Verrucomicrobiales bacterium]|nr:hypothetical protein [Verrucomicrobiales bacterium]